MTKDLHTKAKEITESELKTYEERTKESSRHTHEAQKVLPKIKAAFEDANT